ncbi:MAG: hypothetical protein JWO40_485 [Candidatus Doudnabacteria bacterium]|nr:hypothetical protein [Candidatus Doudnabacteria bacterium]
MGKHFALTLQLPKYRSERSVKIAPFTLENKKLGISVLVLGSFLVLTYLVQVNSFSTKGYEIRNLQTKVDQLKNDQRALEVQSAELQSLQRIQADPAVLNMVPVSTISYVQTTSLSQR